MANGTAQNRSVDQELEYRRIKSGFYGLRYVGDSETTAAGEFFSKIQTTSACTLAITVQWPDGSTNEEVGVVLPANFTLEGVFSQITVTSTTERVICTLKGSWAP